MRGLLRELSSSDDILDVVFLIASLVAVAPPGRTFVFALETKMFAGFTCWFAFFAFLSSETASVAT